MSVKEELEVLLKDLKHRFLVRKDGDENIQRDYIKIVETALNRLEKLESPVVSVAVSPVGTGARMSGKQYYDLSMSQRMFNLEKFLYIIKKDFFFDSFDEFVPKASWYNDEEKQNFVKEMLK